MRSAAEKIKRKKNLGIDGRPSASRRDGQKGRRRRPDPMKHGTSAEPIRPKKESNQKKFKKKNKHKDSGSSPSPTEMEQKLNHNTKGHAVRRHLERKQ